MSGSKMSKDSFDTPSDSELFDFAETKAATIYCSESGHWVFVSERGVKHENRRGVLGPGIRDCIRAAMKEDGK